MKRKLNHFEKLKAGIELNDSSKTDLLEQDNITFKCKTLDGYAPMLPIEEIIETKKKNDVVLLPGYIAAETRPIFSARTRFIKNAMNRKETPVNDSTRSFSWLYGTTI